MILLFQPDLVPGSVTASQRRLEAVQPTAATEEVMRAPGRGTASEPVNEWFARNDAQASEYAHSIALPDLDWGDQQENRFLFLAEREALDILTPEEQKALEHLSDLRRGLKNPRSGQDLIREYEQRKLTRELVEALNRYVSFHKGAD